MACPLLAPGMAAADESADQSEGGALSELAAKGIMVEFVYTGEVIVDIAGSEAAKETESLYLDNIDFTLAFDTDVAGLWKNGLLFAYFLANSGDDPSNFAGDLQVTSNIESNDTTRLYEFWYEHSFMEGRLAVLVGLHDLNSEFVTSDYAGLYDNSSFGIPAVVSANAPVSIFNVAAPGLRVKYLPNDDLTILAAVYDGDPGSADTNRDGFNIRIDPAGEGLFSIVEAQYAVTPSGDEAPRSVYRIGLWDHSGDFEKFSSGEVIKGNYGVYGTFDHLLYEESSGRGIGLIGQVGWAPSDRSEVSFYYVAGLNFVGMIPTRGEDTFGVAVAHAIISDDLARAEREEGGSLRTSETVTEIIYRAQLTEHFAIQPDYQMVTNPGGDPDRERVDIMSLRIEAAF